MPLLATLYARRLRQRQLLAARYGSLGLVQTASGGRLTWQRHLPAGLFLGGLTILMIALARPEATVSLPRVVTAKDCSTGLPVGDWPMLPTANCWFWFATACCTSVAVTPSAAMRSGLSQIRIA